MSKSFKQLREYISGFAIGPIDTLKPMSSLGGSQSSPDRRYTAQMPQLAATYSGRGMGTYKPMISANVEKKTAEMYKLTRKAMSIMPGSQKQKEIKIQLNKVRKELGLDPVKEETLNEKLGYVVRYTDSKNKKFATAFKMKKDAENKSNQLKKSQMKDISITTHSINYNNQINFRGLDKPLSLEDTNRIKESALYKHIVDKKIIKD